MPTIHESLGDTAESAPQGNAAALHRELVHEQLRGVRRINLLRFTGVSAFFALFILLGGVLGMPAWTGNLAVFGLYWAIAAIVFSAGRRFDEVASASTLAIALLDTPLVFLLQWSTFPTSPSASGVAGFTVGVYVLFVILAALSLERRYIWLTAAMGAAFEVALQWLADVSVGGMVSTVLLLGLATVACSYARERLVQLVGRVETAAQAAAAQQSTEQRLRETTMLLGIAQALAGVTEVPEALRRICRELGRLTGADTVAAYMVESERGELRPVAAYHVPKEMLGQLRAVPVPLEGLAFTGELERGRLLWSDRIAEQPNLALWSAEQFPHRSGLVVPMILEDKVAGAFYLAWWTSASGLDAPALALVEAIGRQVGMLIRTAQLYEQLDDSRQRTVQAERLRALGEMAAGVAHDFNNLLAIILGRAELMQKAAESPEAHRSLDVIIKAARDGGRTVRRIQEFTRLKPRGPREPINLPAIIGEVIEMTRARWGDEAQARGVRYEVTAEDAAAPPVLGDAAEVREALTNVVFNALDAMPKGGRLTVRTRADGTRVRCDVADTGVGMAPDVRARAFEPFFSTKVEKGSGLGLAVVYGIVTRLGGEVAVESTQGAGSVFTFWLPTAPREATAAEAGPPPRLTRPARILLVDDETEVRRVLSDMLRAEGHRPVACSDCAAALRAFEAGPYDLVLTDLGMPEVSGWEMAEAVKRRRPGTPVGLITGWGESVDPEEAARRGVDLVVSKPFRIADINEALGRLASGLRADGQARQDAGQEDPSAPWTATSGSPR